jgi:hypothetical protein
MILCSAIIFDAAWRGKARRGLARRGEAKLIFKMEHIIMESRPVYLIHQDTQFLLKRLQELLNHEQLVCLIELLNEVKNHTGYGSVEIWMKGGFVHDIQIKKSYKP